MKKKSKFLTLVLVLFIILFLIFGSLLFLNMTGRFGSFSSGFRLPFGKIRFEGGSFSRKETVIGVVLKEGESSLLSGFESLEIADFSGSRCYDEILSWAEENPQVDVIWSAEFPNGSSITNRDSSADLSGLDEPAIYSAAEDLKFFRSVKVIDLGSFGNVSSMPSSACLDALKSALPEADLNWSVTFLGKEYSSSTDTLDLRNAKSTDIADAVTIAAYMPDIREIGIGANADVSWDDISALSAAAPDAVIDYSFELYGKSFTLSDEIINLSHVPVSDEGAAVKTVLPFLKNCRTLDMDYCGVSNEAMASIRNAFPDVDVIWRIWFGDTNMYSVRTDTERILASKPSIGGSLSNEQVDKLKYCTKVKYLDLGHNETITDISFAASMPDLEVFIIAMAQITDLSPLAHCTHLEYLEAFSTQISDVSPLAGLQELRHLNIGYNPNLSDISPLYGLTDLRRLWVGRYNQVPEEQIAQMRAAAPGCTVGREIDTGVEGPTGGWKYTIDNHMGQWDETLYYERYALLSYQFGYQNKQYSFYWMDPLCGDPAPAGMWEYQYVPKEEWLQYTSVIPDL